jgi:uncharacterized caspase-like protein
LQDQGFDVTAAADLNFEELRRAFQDFVAKAQKAGPQSVLFVYLAGRGVQYAGENFFVPVDATIARATDVPLVALRLSDYTQALAGLPAQARIFVLDAARGNDYAKGDPNGALAGGLALVEPSAATLIAFNATPGTIAPEEPGPYGAYAQALVEMLQQGGALDEAFALTRLRVNEATRGAVVPWDQSRIDDSFALSPAQSPQPKITAYKKRPLKDQSPADAYAIAVGQDTISAYEQFIAAFPRDPLVGRVRALLAARREALSWRRSYAADTPSAYWSYMRRYPHGPHYWDARRRLLMLHAEQQPPAHFDAYDFQGLPPPPDDEYVIVDRPVVVFEGDDYAPPPPPPVFILPRQPERFRHLAPPQAAPRGFVPTPAANAAPQDHHPGAHHGNVSQPNFGQQGHAPPQGAAAPVNPQAQPHGPHGAKGSAAVVPTPVPAPNAAPNPAQSHLPAAAPAVAPNAAPSPAPAGQPTANPHVLPGHEPHGSHGGNKPAVTSPPASAPAAAPAAPAPAAQPAAKPIPTPAPHALPVPPHPAAAPHPTAVPHPAVAPHPEAAPHAPAPHAAPAAPPAHVIPAPHPAPQMHAPAAPAPERHAAPPVEHHAPALEHHAAPPPMPHPAPAPAPHAAPVAAPPHAAPAAAPPHPAPAAPPHPAPAAAPPHAAPPAAAKAPPAKPGGKPDEHKP